MIPTFELWGRTFSVYQIMSLCGIFAAGGYACRSAKRRGKSDNDMIILLLVSAIGVVIGMHLLYGLTNLPLALRIVRTPGTVTDFRSFLQAAVMIFGGAVFYGGLLGGLLAGFLYCRWKHMDAALWSDLAAPAIPLFHFFGRIGCFLGGCCFGIPWKPGFVYRYSLIPEANGVPRFPIQLVEAGWNLCLFAVLALLQRKGKCRGHLLQLYLLGYAPARFLFEFFRGDRLRGIWFGLSTSQWISLVLILIVTVRLLWDRMHSRT